MTLLSQQIKSLIDQHGLVAVLNASAAACGVISGQPDAHQDSWCEAEALCRIMAAKARDYDLKREPAK